MNYTLWIDPTPTLNGDVRSDLFAAQHEFAGAIAGLRRTTDLLSLLPDQLFLELYAYEMLERLREQNARHQVCRVPFWPECLFWAANVQAHPCREIERMLPVFGSVVLVDCGEALIAQTAEQVLGGLRFEPACYRQRTQLAHAGGVTTLAASRSLRPSVNHSARRVAYQRRVWLPEGDSNFEPRG